MQTQLTEAAEVAVQSSIGPYTYIHASKRRYDELK
jgi:hypothetical protein